MKDEGRFSKVTRRMWNDAKFRSLSSAKPNAQTLWFRLLTGPELGPIPGLFAVRAPALADVLGWSLAAFRKCWKEIESAGLALADWRAGLVWVPNALKHNEPQGVTTVVGWRAAMRELPECELKSKAGDVILAYLQGKSPAWVRAWTDSSALPDGVPNDEPDGVKLPDQAASKKQEQEQEKREPPSPKPKPPDPMLRSFDKVRSDVIALHGAYKRTFGLSGHKLGGSMDPNPSILAEAIDAHGFDKCCAVLRVAKLDGMVNGSADERGQKHEKISYVFGNPDTFARLARLAEQAEKRERSAGGLEASMNAEPDLSDYDAEAPCPPQ